MPESKWAGGVGPGDGGVLQGRRILGKRCKTSDKVAGALNRGVVEPGWGGVNRKRAGGGGVGLGP